MEPESSRRVFDGKLIQVDVELWPAGEREVVRHPGACAVVAVTAEGEVLLVRQFRESVRQELLEIPAGIFDVHGEDAGACAVRELLEETGYQATKLERLGTIRTSPGFTDERIELFSAEARSTGKAPEEGVFLTRMSMGDAVAAAVAGRITDAKTVCSLLLMAQHSVGSARGGAHE